MNNRIAIRTATADDIASLIALYGELNPGDETPGSDDARRILDQIGCYPGSTVLVGVVNDVLVATCTLIVVPNLTRGGAPYALIENVVTAGEHRKHGYGRMILKQAVSRAWDQGCYKVMLLTGSQDPATLKFYEGSGFEQSKAGFQVRRRAAAPRRAL